MSLRPSQATSQRASQKKRRKPSGKTLNSLRTRVIIPRVRRYPAIIGWFARDILQGGRRQIALMTGASTIGALGQIGAFAIGYMYLKTLEAGETIHALGVTIDPRISGLFMATILSVSALLIVAAFFEFAGTRMAAYFGAIYGDRCARRALNLASRAKARDDAAPDWAVDQMRLFTIVARDCRQIGVAARLLANGLANLAGLPVALAAMLYIDPRLTGLIFLVLAAFSIFYYLISLRGAELHRMLENMASAAAVARRQPIRRLLNSSGPLLDDDNDLEAAFNGTLNLRYRDAFAGQRVVLALAIFISRCAVAVSFAVVAVVAGYAALHGEASWSDLIAFVIALHLMSSRLVGAARVTVGINRFFPTIREFTELMSGLDEDTSRAGDTGMRTDAHWAIQLPDGHVVEIADCTHVGYFDNGAPPRASILLLQAALRRPDAARPVDIAYVTPLPVAGAATIRQHLGLAPGEGSGGQAKQFMRTLGLPEAVANKTPENLDTVLDERTLGKLPPSVVCGLFAWSAARRGADGVLLQRAVFADLQPSERASAIKVLARNFTIVLSSFSVANRIPAQDWREVIITDGERVLDLRLLEDLKADPSPLEMAARTETVRSSGASDIDEVDLI